MHPQYNIITTGQGQKFYRLTNADGKAWIIPAKNMRVAFNLYQPSGIKGILLKKLFPILHRLPFVGKAIKAEELHCTLQEELHNLLCKIFGREKLEFAIFEGTPGVHKKTTMQVSLGNHILGYCKFSNDKKIMSLFEKEHQTLQVLNKKGVDNIPQALFCGTLSNGTHLFVQSTKKTLSSKTVHKWGDIQERFLDAMHEKTKQKIKFEESDFYHSLTVLQEHIDWLPANVDKKSIIKNIDTVKERNKNKIVEYSAVHADFTPWNIFVERKELFVFDFEYSALTYPQGLDKFHFLLQTAIFEKHLTKEELAEYIKAYSCNEKEIIRMYLLDIVSRFTIREGKKVEGDTAQPFEYWNHILSVL